MRYIYRVNIFEVIVDRGVSIYVTAINEGQYMQRRKLRNKITSLVLAIVIDSQRGHLASCPSFRGVTR